MNKWSNVARNAIRPSYLPVMLGKVRRRAEPDTRDEATVWARERAVAVDDYARAVDDDLWTESRDESQRIEDDARARLDSCPHDLGGGGAYPLLHFLVRLRRPNVVVETGVAAGWSSRAILEALSSNGSGQLFSSDFPYFRFESPETFIGFAVPEELRSNWSLDVRGDSVALPEIVKRVASIDIFHYDSDKSQLGRRFAMKTVSPLLGPKSIVLMDDIQDNVFFRDYCAEQELTPMIFEFQGKFVGALGLPPPATG